MKTILISGGAGFLGSHLCDRLIETNRVFCLDNFFTGRKANIAHLQNHPHFTLVEHDILHPIYFEKQRIDQIYNLACPASPIHYQHNAIRTIKTNVLGTIHLLGMAKLHKARILQASTSEVYGDPKEHPQNESYRGNVNPIGIRSCYDEGKRCAETLMFDYHRQHGIDIRVARIFNTYGPRMSAEDGRVVSNFVLQALAGKSITAYGNGRQTRSFCFVSDLIEAMILLMQKADFKGPLNIGNPREFTILELAHRVISLTDSSSKIAFKPLPKDDPQRRQPDITLAKQMLNWEPRIELEEGLRATIDYFKNLSST